MTVSSAFFREKKRLSIYSLAGPLQKTAGMPWELSHQMDLMQIGQPNLSRDSWLFYLQWTSL
jgi:hypothetical protein